MSSTWYSFVSSWAWYFLVRRTVFFITGWVKRRSTRTTTVLSCLSLTTTPWSVRFGISAYSDFAFERAARFGLAAGFSCGAALPAGAPARFWAAMVMMRAISRRTWRTRAVFSSWPVARWKRRLKRSFLSLSASSSSWSTVMARRSAGFMINSNLFRDALDEARLDRQLGGGEPERFARQRFADAIDLEQNPAGLDAGDPELRGALARAHAHLERLLRHRHIGIDPDPDPAGALHVAGERAPRRLDLARGHALGLERLEPELPERQRDAGGRNALDAALVRLAELGAHRLQHGSSLSYSSIPPAQEASRRGRPASPSAIRLSCAIGSCSMISPLKIHTFTPQVP